MDTETVSINVYISRPLTFTGPTFIHSRALAKASLPIAVSKHLCPLQYDPQVEVCPKKQQINQYKKDTKNKSGDFE